MSDGATLEPSPFLRGVTAYRSPPPGPPCDLLLAGNEGPPLPPDFLAGVALDPTRLQRYPDARALEARLAARFGLGAEQVLVTAGGDDAIDRICRATLAPGRSVVLPTPSFEMIPRDARLTGAEVREVPWPEGPFPVAAFLDAADQTTRLVAVVTPNNPTGAVASPAALRRLSAALPGALLLVDAAYAEFAAEDPTPVALELGNAVVVRTLSKAWSLAGLRVGYVLGPAEVIEWLRAAGLPYPVSGPSLQLAAAWLDRGAESTEAAVAQVRRERAALSEALSAGGLRPLPSQGNFVLARGPQASWLRTGLAGLGIAVRTWSERPDLRDAVRVSCPAQPAAAERLLASVATALRPEALLFDMDGVLADVSSSYRRAIEETAQSFGVTLGPDAIGAAKRQGGANDDWELTWRLVQAHGDASQRAAASLAEVTRRFEERYQGTPEQPGLWLSEGLLTTRELLASLAARLPLAIVTGRPRADALRFLGQFELSELFPLVVAREDAAALKPDPAPVRAALAGLGVSRAWLIGDTPDDVRAARAASALPLGVVAPGDAAEASAAALTAAGAAQVLSSLQDLADLLTLLDSTPAPGGPRS